MLNTSVLCFHVGRKNIYTHKITHTHKRIISNWQVIISSEKRAGFGKREQSRGTLQLYLYNLNFLKLHILMQTAYITMQLFLKNQFPRERSSPIFHKELTYYTESFTKKKPLRKMR